MIKSIIYLFDLVFATIFILGFSSCRFIEKIILDDKLSIEKQSFSGKQLKTNGYYYFEKNNRFFSNYFLYNDGTLLYGDGSFTNDEFLEHELMFMDKTWINSVKNCKFYWGLYKIEGKFIEFERWYPSSGGPLHTYIKKGEIINDTTFIITKSMRSEGSEQQIENDIYHFRKFSPKPDSTNVFIK